MNPRSFCLTLALALGLAACSPSSPDSIPESESVPAGDGGVSPLLFGIGMHIEPVGPTAQMVSRQSAAKGADYNNPATFEKGLSSIQAVVDIVEAHDGKLTIQAQSPFTTAVLDADSPVLSDWEDAGHEIGLHFHEDAHLGADADALPVSRWCEVLKEELGFLREAGVDDVRYWSGGNLYPNAYEAAECAGLSVNGDWKNPATQQIPAAVSGPSPWRPSGGTDGEDLATFATHDPDGPIVFVPDGRSTSGGFGSSTTDESDEAYFEYMEASLLAALEAAQDGKVNAFHFTIHPGEFRGDVNAQFAVIDRFLEEVVDPLVAEGKIKWATMSEVAEAFEAWELAHPGADPRAAGSSAQADLTASATPAQTDGTTGTLEGVPARGKRATGATPLQPSATPSASPVPGPSGGSSRSAPGPR